MAALLVISGVLNLFFVAGAVWTRVQPPAAPSVSQPRYGQIAAELGLTPVQRSGFERYVAAMRARSDEMHRQIAPLIAAAWDEIAKPQADPSRIMTNFDAASQKWREFQRQSTAQTLQFLASLSPEQRSRFIAIAREHRAPWLRGHGATR